MQTKSMIPPQNAQMRIILSFGVLFWAILLSIGYIPCLILVGFFLFQLTVQLIGLIRTGTVAAAEPLFTGPAKIGVSLAMIGSGITVGNDFWGLTWVGVALLFLYSGLSSLYRVTRSMQAESGHQNISKEPVTARQRTKSEKLDEQLFAELAEYLANNDPTKEGNK